MEKHGFKIIAIVFWVWFSTCQLYMHYGFVENPPLIKTLTTSSIAFLGTATCSVCFLYDDLNKKFLPLCIISLITVYIFICLNYFGCWDEPRAKLIGIAIVVIPVTLFFNKLYKF
jgi:hypothetical protein